MSKVRVTFTEKFALENYGVVTYHGVLIPLYGLIDNFIEIFYIEVVPIDVKMFYELKFKNGLTIDQKLRLIAETYEGRRRIKEFSSFGTNASFAEKQLKFVPDWYIFANGPITKYMLGNNAYSEFYYEPLTEDDKWVRYFGIIPKSVPLITSLFNRTSRVMGRLITGIPLPPAVPAVRGSGRNLPPPRPPRGPPPGPPAVVPRPPAILRSGLPPAVPGPPAVMPGPYSLPSAAVPGSSTSSLSSSPPRPGSPTLGTARGRGKRGRTLSLRPQRLPGSTKPPEPGPIHTVDAGEIFSPLNSEILDTSLRSTIPPTVDTADVAEVVAAAGGINLDHIAPGPDDKISATKEITLGPHLLPISESKDEGSGSEHDGDSDISSEYLSEYGSVKGSGSDSEHGSDTDTEVKSKSPAKIESDSEHGLSPAQTEALKKQQAKEEEVMSEAKLVMSEAKAEVLIPEKEDEANAPPPYDYYKLDEEPVDVDKLLLDAPDFENRVTFDSPPEYSALEKDSIEILPTPNTIQQFIANAFKIQYQSNLADLKVIAKDLTIRKYIPEGVKLRTSDNKATHIKVILQAYANLVSNQGYEYAGLQEEKLLYNSIGQMIETFGSLEKVDKGKVEKYKKDYIKSIKLVPEYLDKLSLSERKLIVAKQERLRLQLQANEDTARSMTITGEIEGQKLAAAFIAAKNDITLLPPLDSSRNIATVLTFLGHSNVSSIVGIMNRKYKFEINMTEKDVKTGKSKPKGKDQIAKEVKDYFLNLKIPGTAQFINDFAFDAKGDIDKFAKKSPQKKT